MKSIMATLVACLLTCLLPFSFAQAEQVFRIEFGKDYRNYSDSDLRRRVWELERAVWQLQTRVFQLEANKPTPTADTWLCTIKTVGDSYTGTGPSKALATKDAIENCKKANHGSGFFCKEVKCEQ